VVFFVRWCPLCFSEGLDSRFRIRSAYSGLLCVVLFAATFATSFFGVVTWLVGAECRIRETLGRVRWCSFVLSVCFFPGRVAR